LKRNPMVKITYILVLAFICNSIGLSYLYSHYGDKKEKDAVNIISESFRDKIIKKDSIKIDNFKDSVIKDIK
ncbi:MAG: hypothetical protein OEY79_04660, partial [Anaplasmataceae bacterium]|nr:hypothetical protein [Anaplasmataceae bacterium]